ncbi:sporulation integral membrane protein YtvI [Caproiciproducens galactitolivorans]|uniref:Sporulation integral membrane protein YtvI n=1 Tax=Caproiciproducens galactitolivorans TaxID=642589 RepID=A0ABT4BU67_9FIRM|nr:sporulation integral membrane protein YtvI [Caproiciproducens galactitolivorans]MCY1714440.1 sporulation integral membrane protein YtvI [Caproiciproducens galactitolivorans]
MFEKRQLTRLKPLLYFFIEYTVVFFLFAVTLKYTFPFVAGFLLALSVQPLIRVLKEHLHFKPGVAAAVSTLVVFCVVFGILFLIGYWLISEISHLLNHLTVGVGSVTGPINRMISTVGEYLSKIDSKYVQQNQEQIMNIAQSGAGVLKTVLGSILAFLTSLPAVITMFIVMILSTYFFSKDMTGIKTHVKSLFSRNAVFNIRSASHHGISLSGKYICSYLFIYFITFIETLIVFFALGVPYPLVLSIITGIADILPVLGPGTIYIPLALFYVIKGSFLRAGILLLCYFLITAIRQIIEPKIVSSSINIHPLTMLAAIYFSLVAQNFWLLIYFSVLLILYKILTNMEVLPTLFEEPETVVPAETESCGNSVKSE